MSAPHRPRVAMVTDAIAPFHRGGKEQRYHQLAWRIGRTADVHIYTMKWWRGRRPPPRDGVTFHAICPRVAIYRGERRSTLEAVVFALGCLRLLGARVDVIEADHMPYLQLFVLKGIAWARRKPLVVTWHEVWDAEQWRSYLGGSGRLGWALERLATRLPDRILATSEETAARLRALGITTPVVAAPGGVDLAAIAAVRPAPPGTEIVSIGRLLRHKRHDLLLDAVAGLPAALRPTCTIVGDGPELDNLRLQAERLGIGGRTRLLRTVESDEQLLALVKGARVCVFTSEREGFGIAALEAIASGVPVITTAAPHNLAQHLVARAARGVVCEPTAQALAAAIELVLAGPAPGAGGEERWLRDYDWDRVAEVSTRALLHPTPLGAEPAIRERQTVTGS